MKAKELWDLFSEDLAEEVWEDVEQDDHECLINAVYRTEDGRFWLMFFTRDGEGNNHSWRDGYADDPEEVEPFEATVTAYRKKET